MAKCVDCGFLAARNKETRQLHEVERSADGSIDYNQYGTGYMAIYDNPICFARAVNLPSQYGTEPIRQVLERERDCKPFTKWQQGFTPKEHREMIDRDKMHKWHIIELVILIVGNLLAAGFGAFVVWLVTRGGH